jgi:Tfp pilus assembly protein PilF
LLNIILHGNSEISNKEAKAIFESGLRFVEQGDYGTARQRFFEANHECPNNPVILNAIGGTFSQTGNPDRGNTYFERALKLDSNFINSYTNFGSSLNLTMRFEEAKQIFRLGLARSLIDSFNRSSLFLNLANSYFLNKEYDSALIFIDSAKANSGHGRIYNLAVQAQSQINIRIPLPPAGR